MKVNGFTVNVGSYLVVLSTDCFFTTHQTLQYCGERSPRVGSLIKAFNFQTINNFPAIRLVDDHGIYYASATPNYEYCFRWPTTQELWTELQGSSFRLNGEVLHVVAVDETGKEQLKNALTGDIPWFFIDKNGSRQYTGGSVSYRPAYYPSPRNTIQFHDSNGLITDDNVTNNPNAKAMILDIEAGTTNKEAVQEIRDQFPSLFQTCYSYGNRFDSDFGEHILAQTGPSEVAFISLVNGNRYSEPVKVGDPSKILASEIPSIKYFTLKNERPKTHSR